MNANTKKRFKEFIEAVEVLAEAVSETIDPEATQGLFEASSRLKDQLDSDETILQ